MPQPITDPLAPQCGTCKFWDRVPNHPSGEVGECTGVPPTPCIVGARPRQFGAGVDYQLEVMRPLMAHNARPCALYARAMLLDLSRGGPTSALA